MRPELLPYEEIEHTADIALRIRGKTWEELLINAARGLSRLLANEDELSPRIRRSVSIAAGDPESLLVEWLSELIFFAEMESLVFSQFQIEHADSTMVRAQVAGNHVPELQKYIKAVTYNNLAIRQDESGFETTVVFDI